MQRIRTIALLVAPLLIAVSQSSAAQETPWRWALDFGWSGGTRPVAQSALAVAASAGVVHRRHWDARVEVAGFKPIFGERTGMFCFSCSNRDFRDMAEFATTTLMFTAGPTRRNVYALGGLGAYAGRWSEKSGGGRGPSSLVADVGFGGFLRTGLFETDRVKLEGRVRLFTNTNRGSTPGLLVTAGYAR